jgi:hypothetical protein
MSCQVATNLSIYINTMAPIDAYPLRYTFMGASFTMRLRGTRQFGSGHGHPKGVADNNEPLRSETNRTHQRLAPHGDLLGQSA